MGSVEPSREQAILRTLEHFDAGQGLPKQTDFSSTKIEYKCLQCYRRAKNDPRRSCLRQKWKYKDGKWTCKVSEKKSCDGKQRDDAKKRGPKCTAYSRAHLAPALLADGEISKMSPTDAKDILAKYIHGPCTSTFAKTIRDYARGLVMKKNKNGAVSYTHLTLPTILRV